MTKKLEVKGVKYPPSNTLLSVKVMPFVVSVADFKLVKMLKCANYFYETGHRRPPEAAR